MPFDLILRGARVIDPSQNLDAVADVAFAAGKVAMVGNGLKVDPGTEGARRVGVTSLPPRVLSICTPTSIGAATSIGVDAEEFCRTSGVTHGGRHRQRRPG